MKNVICVKLVFFLFLNIVAVPVMQCGGKKGFKKCYKGGSRNKSKFFIQGNRFTRRECKQERIRQDVYNKRVSKRLRKMEVSKPKPVDFDEILRGVLRKIAHVPGHAAKFIPKGKSIKMLVKTGILKEVTRGVLTLGTTCITRYEDDKVKIRECCTSTLIDYRCWEETIYKTVATACSILNSLSGIEGSDCSAATIISFANNTEAFQGKTIDLVRLSGENKSINWLLYLLVSAVLLENIVLVAAVVSVFCCLCKKIVKDKECGNASALAIFTKKKSKKKRVSKKKQKRKIMINSSIEDELKSDELSIDSSEADNYKDDDYKYDSSEDDISEVSDEGYGNLTVSAISD